MQQAEILAIAGLRLDGRRFNELRKIKYKLNVDNLSDGSTYLEQGLNKVLVLIDGPKEMKNKGNEMNNEKGVIQCTIKNAPFSGVERKAKKTVDRRIQEMESIIIETFESVILMELYPKSEINIVVHILESDGSIICTIINAITMALLDAGVAMIDLVVSCSVGRLHNQLHLDITQLEQSSGIYLPVAMRARNEEIVYMQLDNRLSLDILQNALEEVKMGCREIAALIESGMKEYMSETLRIQSASFS